MWHVFDPFRSRASKDAERLKASASEILGIYSIVRHWAASIVGPRPEIVNQRASFDAACDTLDILIQAKRRTITLRQASVALSDACSRHMRLHIAAYGTDKIKPTHHWMFDIAEQLGVDDAETMTDAWIIERLHLRVKRHADPIKELGVYEKSVVAGVINEHFEDATRPLTDGLRGKPYVYDGSNVSDHMVVAACCFSVSDVVARGTSMGIIALCVEEDGVLMVIVHELGEAFQVFNFKPRVNSIDYINFYFKS